MKLDLNPESIEILLNVLTKVCTNDFTMTTKERSEIKTLRDQIQEHYPAEMGMTSEEFINKCLSTIPEKVVDQDIWPDSFGWNARFIAVNEYHLAIQYYIYNLAKELIIKRTLLRDRSKEEENGTNEAQSIQD